MTTDSMPGVLRPSDVLGPTLQEAAVQAVLNTPEPDRYVDCGEARPLPMFHMSTLMQYAEACVVAATTECSERWQARLTAAARPPMTQAQIDHLVTEFHRTRRFHGNSPEDIVRAVETFHGIRGA